MFRVEGVILMKKLLLSFCFTFFLAASLLYSAQETVFVEPAEESELAFEDVYRTFDRHVKRIKMFSTKYFRAKDSGDKAAEQRFLSGWTSARENIEDCWFDHFNECDDCIVSVIDALRDDLDEYRRILDADYWDRKIQKIYGKVEKLYALINNLDTSVGKELAEIFEDDDGVRERQLRDLDELKKHVKMLRLGVSLFCNETIIVSRFCEILDAAFAVLKVGE